MCFRFSIQYAERGHADGGCHRGDVRNSFYTIKDSWKCRKKRCTTYRTLPNTSCYIYIYTQKRDFWGTKEACVYRDGASEGAFLVLP